MNNIAVISDNIETLDNRVEAQDTYFIRSRQQLLEMLPIIASKHLKPCPKLVDNFKRHQMDQLDELPWAVNDWFLH